MTNQTTPDFTQFLASVGEMGKLVAAKDWSKSPLGPIETWPQSLRTTLSLCFASNFPIAIVWGSRRIQIYNDGYRVICGDKHPESMGQDFAECWASAWPAIGEAFESALNGKTSYLENVRLFVDRRGYLEESFFTFSFSPIRDESGGVGGLFHPVTEQTARMLGERRTRAIRDLTVGTANATAVDAVFREAVNALSTYSFDLPFVLVYRLDKSGATADLAACCGLNADSPLCPATVAPGDASPWPLNAASLSSPITLIDLSETFHVLPSGPYEEPTTRAFFIPIGGLVDTGSVAFVIAGISPRLPLDEQYQDFFTMVAATVSAAMANAHAHQENANRAKALVQLDRAKTAFFSNVSHELRTPLTLILGPLEDLLGDTELRLPDLYRKQIELVQRNAHRLMKLVNTLLDFSRIEAGRVNGMFEPVDLGNMTAELVSHFRSACEKAGLDLRINCPPSVVPVYVDPEMWEKIVLNLVSNAFKYTLAGTITVSLRVEEASARLDITDTGVGIVEQELPRVFDRFHRIEGQKGRTHEGTGIGLALVAELVKLHGGEICVSSEVGRGSQFTVTLPLGCAHLPRDRVLVARQVARSGNAIQTTAFTDEVLSWLPAVPDELKSSQSAWQDDTKACRGRIVLADDNQDMRAYIQRILEKAGYAVDAVTNGVDALCAATSSDAVDLVLTDVMMPGLDGFGVIRAIREDPATQNMLVILLSARAGEEARIEGLAAGADDYIVKPFVSRELLARIDSAIRLARDRREAAARESELKSQIQSERTHAAQSENETKLQFVLEAARLAKLAEEALYCEKERLRVANGELVALNTKLADTQMHLQQSEKMASVGILAAGVAHEINNPIGYVNSNLGALQSYVSKLLAAMDAYGVALDSAGNAASTAAAAEIRQRFDIDFLTVDVRQLVAESREGIDRVCKIVNDLKDFSRVSRGSSWVRADVNAGLESTLNIVSNQLKYKAQIVKTFADLPLIECLPSELNQVFLNILMNAGQAIADHGLITVSTGQSGDKVWIAIGDDGAGIPADVLPRIFDPFFTTKAIGSGSGLGLSISYGIIAKHHGTIDVTSAPGEGTLMRVELPIEQPK